MQERGLTKDQGYYSKANLETKFKNLRELKARSSILKNSKVILDDSKVFLGMLSQSIKRLISIFFFD